MERHSCIFEFQANLSNIIKSLESISEWDEQVSSSKAKCLLNAVCNCEFVVTLFTLSNILCVTLAASKLLQGIDYGIVAAKKCIDDILKTLENKRTNCELVFKDIFEESKTVMTELDINVKIPRIVKRQSQRPNTPASNPEEYYRRVQFIHIIENVVENLKVRFSNEKNNTIFLLMQLIPINAIEMSSEINIELVETLMKHYSFLNFNIYSLNGELELWKTKWNNQISEGDFII